ncbi:MAG: hypothetical protein R3B06_18830 [Kofleriaceae bacterium]
MIPWSRERQRRFAHHVLLPDVGGRGQDRLTAATVAIDVDGRAGQVASLYLAAGGVGALALRGRGRVVRAEFPFDEGDVGAPLVAAVARAARARQPAVALVDDDALPSLAIVGDAPRLPLAEAFARGGEAAARWLHARAIGEAP